MSQNYFLERGAEEDLEDHVAYLFQEASEDIATRFVLAFEETASRLVDQPAMGRVYVPDSLALKGMRAFRVSGFPRHIIFYRLISERVHIERILHASRRIWSILGLED